MEEQLLQLEENLSRLYIDSPQELNKIIEIIATDQQKKDLATLKNKPRELFNTKIHLLALRF